MSGAAALVCSCVFVSAAGFVSVTSALITGRPGTAQIAILMARAAEAMAAVNFLCMFILPYLLLRCSFANTNFQILYNNPASDSTLYHKVYAAVHLISYGAGIGSGRYWFLYHSLLRFNMSINSSSVIIFVPSCLAFLFFAEFEAASLLIR